MTIAVPRSLKSLCYRFPDPHPPQGTDGIVVPRTGSGGWEGRADPSNSEKLEVQTGGQDGIGHPHAEQSRADLRSRAGT